MSHALLFMGEQPEEFRCRIYGAFDVKDERKRAFVEALAGDGVLDAPAYDNWVMSLRERGWIDAPKQEPAPHGGYFVRWKLSDKGRREWAAMKEREGWT